MLLPERKRAVDDNHADDGAAESDHPLTGLAEFSKKRQARCGPKNEGKEVSETLEKLPHRRLASNRLDFIPSKFRESPRGFCRRNPIGAALQAGKGFLDREVMDFHLGASPGEGCALLPRLWMTDRKSV